MGSLLSGLEETDDIEKIQERLEHSPTDLHIFFQRMLNSTQEAYHVDAARVLLLAVEANWLDTSIAYFVQTERRNPDDAVSSEMRPVSRDEFEGRDANAKANAMEWCKDLLEIVLRVIAISFFLCIELEQIF